MLTPASTNEKVTDRGLKYMFRLLDDDKETYFLGYCEKDSSFAPLDDYGASYGCTEIQYKVNGRWTTL